MKSLLLSLLVLPAALHASTTAPMFAGSPGTTLTIQGQTYTWTGPATEDGTWHNDTYTCTDNSTAATYTVTVKGLISNPQLATVTGSDATGAVNGYLSGGTYGNCQNSSESDGNWTVYGVNYTHLETQDNYSVNLYGWELDNIYDYQYSSPDSSIHFWGNTAYDESHWLSIGNNAPPSSGMNSINAFGTT